MTNHIESPISVLSIHFVHMSMLGNLDYAIIMETPLKILPLELSSGVSLSEDIL